MYKVYMNNMGVPPLAGVCTYEEACKPSNDVEENIRLFKRYNYMKTRLNKIYAAHLTGTPEWELKCAFGLHSYLESEHVTAIRKRVTEMRNPPHHLDKVPDDKLEALMEEVIRAEDSLEFLVGIYQVLKPEMLSQLRKHMEVTHPIFDHPTMRMLKMIIQEEEEMVEFGKQALQALIHNQEDHERAEKWSAHVATYLAAAGGISGKDDVPENLVMPTPRSDGSRYQMQTVPQRDARFDQSLSTAIVPKTIYNEDCPYDERTFALILRRLSEIDVPDWMAPIIYETEGKPWEYYADLSRQMWDESRHAMMGEICLYENSMPFYEYPLIFGVSVIFNEHFTPFEVHVILWGLEQSLMPKETGKREEWRIAYEAGNELAALCQDYDWADEVLHAQIGRKWLVPEVGGLKELKDRYEPLIKKFAQLKAEWDANDNPEPWWERFLEDIRNRRANTELTFKSINE